MVKKKKRPLKPTGRRGQVLKLLSDKKIHKTNELRLPPKTRAWASSQWEDRNYWFSRAQKEKLIKLVGKKGGVNHWKITKKGLKVLGRKK